MRCILITGGTLDNLKQIRETIEKDDSVICADGGAKCAISLDIVPDIVIGDFDSLSATDLEILSKRKTLIKKHPAVKDDTDTALAMSEAILKNPDEIIIFGALGTRFDHSLANIHLLKKALDHGIKAKIIDRYNEVLLVSPESPEILHGKPGDIFSLLPLTEKVTGVTVKGARWELENATFFIGNPYGISNELAAEKTEITIGSGLLLLIKIKDGDEK